MTPVDIQSTQTDGVMLQKPTVYVGRVVQNIQGLRVQSCTLKLVFYTT